MPVYAVSVNKVSQNAFVSERKWRRRGPRQLARCLRHLKEPGETITQDQCLRGRRISQFVYCSFKNVFYFEFGQVPIGTFFFNILSLFTIFLRP